MVDVEVMEDAKHPLSSFTDHDLGAQVKHCHQVKSQMFQAFSTGCNLFLLLLQVAKFPFMKLMSLLVVMPLSGQVNVSSLSAKLNISDLYDRLPKERAVQVKVPKFKLEYSQELQEVLTRLGKIYFFKYILSQTSDCFLIGFFFSRVYQLSSSVKRTIYY